MIEISLDQKSIAHLRRIENFHASSLKANAIDLALKTITKYCDDSTESFFGNTNATVVCCWTSSGNICNLLRATS